MKSLGIKFVRCAFASLFAFAFALAASAEVTIQWFDVTAADITSGGEWDPAAPTVFGSDLLIDSEDAPVTYTPASAVLENDATFTIDICFSNSVSTTDVDVSAAQAAITIVKDESKNFVFAVADNGEWTTTGVEADPATKYTIKIVFDYENDKVSYYNDDSLIKEAAIPAQVSAAKVSNASFQGVGMFNNFVGKYDRSVVASITKEGETSYYVTFDEAYVAAVNGDTIKMLADAEWTSTTFDATKKNVTIDQADGELTINEAVTTAYNSKGYKCKIESGVLKVDFPFAAGDGTQASPYTIPDYETLDIFRQGILVGAYGVKCYKQTANIDFGGKPAWAGIGQPYDKSIATCTVGFTGVYDGDGHQISNLKLVNVKTIGFFNRIGNPDQEGVVQNLIINGATFEDMDSTAEFGGAVVAAGLHRGTIKAVQVNGTYGTEEKPIKSNASGIVARYSGGTLDSCTNNASIWGTGSKVSGIANITQSDTDTNPSTMYKCPCLITGCVNRGDIHMVRASHSDGGVAGILAYSAPIVKTVIQDCVNKGVIASTDPQAQLGQILGCYRQGTLEVSAGCVVTPDQLALGEIAKIYSVPVPDCLDFATVENGVATLVSTNSLAVGGSYKLMAPLAAYEFEFGEVGSVSFDESLYPACAITASKADGVKGLVLRDPVTVENVTTLTAAKRPTVLLFN